MEATTKSREENQEPPASGSSGPVASAHGPFLVAVGDVETTLRWGKMGGEGEIQEPSGAVASRYPLTPFFARKFETSHVGGATGRRPPIPRSALERDGP